MKKYTVRQLAKLAGVSVRTLHHYDEIGLLKPAHRSEKGYRYYGRDELLLLQQIMFYRELDISLKDIAELIESSSYDALESLDRHRIQLQQRGKAIDKLLQTIDKTINAMKNENNMITDEELYEGFSKEEIADMRNEVAERWGADELLNSEKRVRHMGKDKWNEVKQEAEDIAKQFAAVADLPPADTAVQQVVLRHYRHISMFYEVSAERYSGLGKLYVDDPRFTVFYDKHRPGLSVFINEAIHVFCKNGLKTR